MKRILSISMASLLFLMSFLVVNADIAQSDIDVVLSSESANELFLKSHGFTDEQIKEVIAGTYVINIKSGETKTPALVNVTKTADLTRMEVYEDNKHDTILFYDNGDIILNGNKVEVELAEPIAASASNYTTYCPSGAGNADDYTYYAKDKSVNYINFKAKICDLTVGAVIAIISGALDYGIASSVVGFFGYQLVDNWRTPSKVASIKGSIYYHKQKKQFMHDSVLGCQKEILTCYEKNNYKGRHTTRTQFFWMFV